MRPADSEKIRFGKCESQRAGDNNYYSQFAASRRVFGEKHKSRKCCRDFCIHRSVCDVCRRVAFEKVSRARFCRVKATSVRENVLFLDCANASTDWGEKRQNNPRSRFFFSKNHLRDFYPLRRDFAGNVNKHDENIHVPSKLSRAIVCTDIVITRTKRQYYFILQNIERSLSKFYRRSASPICEIFRGHRPRG